MNKYILYALFLTIPFANISIAGHIYPVEIPLLLLVFSAMSSGSKTAQGVGTLDILVVAYAVFSLVSVVAGADSLYESARHYRLMVMTPTLLYLVIRYSPQPLEVMHKGLFLMLPGIFIQGVLLANYYVQYGERPVGVDGAISTITASLFFAIGLGIMFFAHWKQPMTRVRRIVRYAAIIVLFGALILSSTRAAVIGLVVFAPLASYVWTKQYQTRLFGRAMMGTVVGMIVLVLTGTAVFSDAGSDISREEASEIGHSAERLASLELYMVDLRGRMAFWGRMGKKALENPILGSGAARANIGKAGGTNFTLGSAHNVIITVLITTGVIGMTIFILMIWATYRALAFSQRAEGIRDSMGKLILMSFSILLVVALTNDLSGGRAFIWFVLMALASRLLMERTTAEAEQVARPAEDRRILGKKRQPGIQVRVDR